MMKQRQQAAERQSEPEMVGQPGREAESLTTQYPHRQRRLDQFQDHLADYAWSARVIDQQVIYYYYSPLVEALTGYPAFYFLSQTEAWLGLIHAEDQANLKNRLAGPLSGSQVVFEYRLRHADGRLRWVRETISPGQDALGQVIYLDGMVADVTAAKQAEAQLKHHTQELMLLNSILAVAAAAEDETQLLDLVCQKLAYGFDLSRVSAADLDQAKTELQIVAESRSEETASILHRSVAVKALPVLADLLSHQAPVVMTKTGADASLVGLWDLLNPQVTRAILFVPLIIQRQVTGILIIEAAELTVFTASQITFFWNVADQVALVLEKTRLMAEAQQAYEYLKQIQARLIQSEKMSALGQLAAGIAHDFNNILTSIMGFAELSSRVDPLLPAVKRNQTQIIEQSLRGAYLIRQILDFSHRAVSQKQPLDLVALVRAVVKLLQHLIPEDIRLDLTVAPGTYFILADAIQIQQILTNLAVNAKDAIPEGGRLQVHLFPCSTLPDKLVIGLPQPAGPWVAMAVGDSGCGIPEQVLPHLFEPFFTTKPVGQGTGLGLAQVYGLVRQHDGYIDVTTALGRGTTFTLYLPRLEPTETRPPPADQAILPRGQGETVLLVEDEVTVLRVIGQILTGLNYHVLTATNGQEALSVYDQHRQTIRLVLTDLTMPYMGGLALAQALRERDPTLKIIALTGYSLETIDKSAVPQSIIGWAQKPLGVAQLAWIVYRSLQSQPSGPDLA